jgi:hypothetical protein
MVTLDVVNDELPDLTVVDELPDGLKFIPETFEVDGSPVTPSTAGQLVSTVVGSGTFEITFDVQVVEAPAEEVTVTNWARLYSDTLVDESSADITLYPYEGFTKDVLQSTSDPWDEVLVGTDVHWLLLIAVQNIDGDGIVNMENPVVKDRFGGDLEVDGASTKQFISPPWTGTVNLKFKGKTKKVQMTWEDFGDLADGDVAQLWIEISTDTNTGTGNGKKLGHQEYTSVGEHYLNSGAVVKFIDSEGTGFQLSAHTPPLLVTAFEEE